MTHDFWHMNETAGRSMKDATGDHPGTLHGVDQKHDGFDGTSYAFDGRSAYVSIPTADDLNARSRDVHISFTLRTASVPDKPDYDLFRKGEAPGQEYKVELQPNGQVSCHFAGSRGAVTVQDGPDVHDGKWHTVSCDKLSGQVVLSVDGERYSKSKSVGSISNRFPIIIGAYPRGDFYEGVLDEVSFSTGRDAVTPPTASFTASPASGRRALKVAFTDTTRGAQPHRTWDFDDDTASRRARPTHTFDDPGSYRVTLTVASAGGTATVTRTITVRKSHDTTAPHVRLRRPHTRPSSVSAWRTLRGRTSDRSGSGVRYVTIRVIERRHGTWFAYHADTHTWLRAASRARALQKAGVARVEPTPTGRFHLRLLGLRHGLLKVRFTATDHNGNVSHRHVVTRRLHHR